jgi:hypothetical protein
MLADINKKSSQSPLTGWVRARRERLYDYKIEPWHRCQAPFGNIPQLFGGFVDPVVASDSGCHGVMKLLPGIPLLDTLTSLDCAGRLAEALGPLEALGSSL